MKVSMKWLARWVDVDGIGADDLAHRLTMSGLEVEAVEKIGEGMDDIVVGRIDSIEDHEKADKLVVCKVDAGEGRQRTIVCGATNMSAGDLVPVALPGSQPPALDFEIGERKVLGIMSEGMLCAEEELGLADESEGLWILPADAPIGVPVFEAMGLVDTVIHLGVTPNRPDALSHRGVAREIAVLYGRDFKTGVDLGGVERLAGGEGDVTEVASLELVDADGCPRYGLAVIEGVKVGPSPDWLVARLAAIGVRSVNNIVDVTNFVLQDVGQPLHAFDLDKLGSKVVVRSAKDGEEIVGIDHKTYKLTSADLVIASEDSPVAIAGVMGGEATEVTESTTRILIECAYFDPTRVRKGAKRHALHTESSHRFERGIDPNGIADNLAMAVELVMQTQEGLDATPVVRKGTIEAYPKAIEPAVIEYDVALYERIMGDSVSVDETSRILEGIGAGVEQVDGHLAVTVPTFRPDLERPIDLVEEVGRVLGFDNVVPTFPKAKMGEKHVVRENPRHAPTIVPRELLRERVDRRALLTSQGLREMVGYSFMSRQDLDRLEVAEGDPRRDVVEVANPLTKEQEYMRTTLLPGLLSVLEHNVQRRRRDVALFEFGRTFHQDGERERLALLVTGPRGLHFSDTRDWDFFDVKGLLDALVLDRELDGEWTKPEAGQAHLHPGIQAEWRVGNHLVGTAGYLHPNILQDLELEAPVIVAEVDLGVLDEAGAAVRKYVAQGRFPASNRDFAFLVSKDTSWGQIEATIHELADEDPAVGELLRSVRVFDLYEGEQVPDGKRSLAMSLEYRSDERTLTDEEIAKLDTAVVERLNDRVGAQLR